MVEEEYERLIEHLNKPVYLQTIETIAGGRCVRVGFYMSKNRENEGLFKSHGITYDEADKMVNYGLDSVLE